MKQFVQHRKSADKFKHGVFSTMPVLARIREDLIKRKLFMPKVKQARCQKAG